MKKIVKFEVVAEICQGEQLTPKALRILIDHLKMEIRSQEAGLYMIRPNVKDWDYSYMVVTKIRQVE